MSSLKEIISGNNNTLDHETLLNTLLVKTNPSFLDKAVNNLSLFEFHSPQNADEQMNEDSYLIYEDGPSEWPDADDTSFDDTRKRKSSHCSSEDSDDDIR